MKITLVICFLTVCSAVSAQDCPTLARATPQAAVSFLNGVKSDPTDADCKIVAFQKIGNAKMVDAIPLLIRFLDFENPGDKFKRYPGHPTSILEAYPAAQVLRDIGNKSMPFVLNAIAADSTTPLARENAYKIISGLYDYRFDKVIPILQAEIAKASDNPTKTNLTWALERAKAQCATTTCADRLATQAQ